MSWTAPPCAGHLLTEDTPPSRWSTWCTIRLGVHVEFRMWHTAWRPEAKWRDHRWRWRRAQQSLLRNRCRAACGTRGLRRSWTTVVDGVHTSTYMRPPFTPSTRLRKRGRCGHFARGLNTIGEEIVDLILDRKRKWVERLNWPSMFLGLQYVWRRYRALVSCACFWNVCPTNTWISRYSASRCGFVRKLRRPSWSRTTLSCARLPRLSSRISMFCASACRFCPMDTRFCSTFAAVFWTSSSWYTPSFAALRSSSPLLWTAPLSFRRCAVPGCHWVPDEFRPLPAYALHALQLLWAWKPVDLMWPSPRWVHGVRSHVLQRCCAQGFQRRVGEHQEEANSRRLQAGVETQRHSVCLSVNRDDRRGDVEYCPYVLTPHLSSRISPWWRTTPRVVCRPDRVPVDGISSCRRSTVRRRCWVLNDWMLHARIFFMRCFLSGEVLPVTIVWGRNITSALSLPPLWSVASISKWRTVSCTTAVICWRLATLRLRRSIKPSGLWTGHPRVFKCGISASLPRWCQEETWQTWCRLCRRPCHGSHKELTDNGTRPLLRSLGSQWCSRGTGSDF